MMNAGGPAACSVIKWHYKFPSSNATLEASFIMG